MKIAYIFRNHPSYNRATKMCNALADAGHEVVFIGWDFNPIPGRRSELSEKIKVYLLDIPNGYGQYSIWKYFRWLIFLLKTLYKEKCDVVQCVDEYPVLMLLPYKHILFRSIVMDVYDSMIRRNQKNSLKRILLHSLRWVANTVSDRIIETSEELKATLGGFQNKAIVIYNSPNDPIKYVENCHFEVQEKIAIAVGGTICLENYALHTLIKVLDKLKDKAFVYSSGVLEDDFANQVWIKHPSVSHRWLNTQKEYFEMLAKCDLLFCVRTDSENSEYASLVFPQKLFDAIAIQRPLLVSSKSWIGAWVTDNGLGLACDPDDEDKMKDSILQLKERFCNNPIFNEKSRSLFVSKYQWKLMEAKLAELYLNVKRDLQH